MNPLYVSFSLVDGMISNTAYCQVIVLSMPVLVDSFSEHTYLYAFLNVGMCGSEGNGFSGAKFEDKVMFMTYFVACVNYFICLHVIY